MPGFEIKSSPRISHLLKMAAAYGVENAIKVHIAKGDDLNARDESGFTPLMIAAKNNRANACKLLLANGVDPLLLNSEGKSALNLAIEYGSLEAAAIIKPNLSPQEIDKSDNESLNTTISDEPAYGDEFALGEWEPESETSPPTADPEISIKARAQLECILKHTPIDRSTEWLDFDVSLPEFAEPVIGTLIGGTRTAVRKVLLRILREGSIPKFSVQDIARNDSVIQDTNYERLICQVINDIGGETNERFEYASSFDNFGVELNEVETSEEEECLNQAADYLDQLSGVTNDPARMYTREISSIMQRTRESEIEIAKRIEHGLMNMLEAISKSPVLIPRILSIADEICENKLSGSTVIDGFNNINEADDQESQIGLDVSGNDVLLNL